MNATSCSDDKISSSSRNGKKHNFMIVAGIDMLRYTKVLNIF